MQSLLLQIDVAEIIVHKTDKPNFVIIHGINLAVKMIMLSSGRQAKSVELTPYGVIELTK